MLRAIRSLLALLCPLLWKGFASRERDIRFVWEGWRVPLVGLYGSIMPSRWLLGGWHPPGVGSKVWGWE